MNESDFWALMGTAHRGSTDRRIQRIARRLARYEPEQITGFADQLAHHLRLLDTPAHAAAAGTTANDAFLAMRCAVVLAGLDTFESVVESAHLMARFSDEDAEPLIVIAEEAYEESTGMAWEHTLPVDIESGTSAAWGRVETASTPADDLTYWFSLLFGSGAGARPSREYEVTLALLNQTLAKDIAWRSWWRTSTTAALEVHLVFDPELPQQQTLRRGRKLFRVEVFRPASGFSSTQHISEPAKARADLIAVLEFVRQKLDLPTTPPFPPAPELPADI
ncbi:DUF4240 domain-containing protein [Micromonosporaceae bacterium Da 78-11]